MGFKTVLIFTLFFIVDPAGACKCARYISNAEDFAGAAIVISGLVTDIKEPSRGFDPILVTVAIDQTWKGPKQTTMQILTANSASACGYAFVKGQRYLIYGHTDSKNKILATSCSKTKAIELAGDDISWLNSNVPVRAK